MGISRKTTLALALICASALTAGAQSFKINDKGYFENYDANVMVFSDVYAEGHQGGVTIVTAGDRRAASGDVRFEVSQGQWQGLPRQRSRVVDSAKNEIRVTLSYPDTSKHLSGFNPAIYPDFAFNYTITVRGEGESVIYSVELDKPVPERFAGKLGLNIELTPSLLLGKPWIMDDQTGVFPHQAFGPTMNRGTNMQYIGDFNPRGKASKDLLLGDDWSVYNPMRADDIVSAPLAEGKVFTLNPQDELGKIKFEALKGTLRLYDGRINHNNGWFVLRTEFAAGETRAEWRITPHANPQWRHDPVIQTSQVGYHPLQNKVAVVELDARETARQDIVLYKITAEGLKEMKRSKGYDWGQLFRYNYLQLDFTDIKEEGLYKVCYGDSESSVFRIANNVWHTGVWQAEIEYFLPMQMCHMRVNEKYRVWHDTCHMDDATMAVTDLNHIDGYTQDASTHSKWRTGDYVDLAVGGWHDAGDYDLRIESQSSQAYLLAMQIENLGAYWDETTIDFDKHIVEIHQPDGINDYLQQVENGVLTILAGWHALDGHFYKGILVPTVRQYTHLGDASAHTDNIVGTADDRWLFTEGPNRELSVATYLAAISRVLKDYKPEMAQECLEIAEICYERAIEREKEAAVAPQRPGMGGFMRMAGPSQRVQCAVELYLTTGDKIYSDFVLSQQDYIVNSITNTAWYIGRFDKAVNNKKFSKAIREALPKVKEQYDSYAARSPYGVPYDMGNRSSGSWEPQSLGYRYAWLYQSYPDIFGLDFMCNSMQYLMGMHPGQNKASLVTGVGAETVKAAYGNNRADWSYIPGGVAPGTNLIRPDLPELLNFPFLWQEGEYCIGGYTTHVSYMAMAADKFFTEMAAKNSEK